MVSFDKYHRTFILFVESSDNKTTWWSSKINFIFLIFFSIDFSFQKNVFVDNHHTHLIIILSQTIPIAKLNQLCTQEDFQSITLLKTSPSILNDERNELEEHLFDKIQVKYLQFPFASLTDSLFLTPTLIPYRLPTIETYTSLTNEKIKV